MIGAGVIATLFLDVLCGGVIPGIGAKKLLLYFELISGVLNISEVLFLLDLSNISASKIKVQFFFVILLKVQSEKIYLRNKLLWLSIPIQLDSNQFYLSIKIYLEKDFGCIFL